MTTSICLRAPTIRPLQNRFRLTATPPCHTLTPPTSPTIVRLGVARFTEKRIQPIAPWPS